ncbi:unnamed protein product [Notodromas monacha]|uniref:3-oxo-5alpha-steroid 4-dehydrogenase (NADP(+)) n=1 Tax=Notodromas monacha TaxID=399045 RepID=A0A7R9BUH1_9CRUS|nr:unnamed protein product [Notodromas monacha]CAG0920357.1 unnamed protein product [Notodromas monacha]
MSYISFSMSCILIVSGLGVLLGPNRHPYGRYSTKGYGFFVPVKLAWVVQESPAFFIPLALRLMKGIAWISSDCVLLLFMLHYFQRSFVYPVLITAGKPSPLSVVISAFTFCAFNGYLQARYLLNEVSYEDPRLTSLSYLCGFVIFILGMAINLHSDHVLRSLRKNDSEGGYKIPYGGLFQFVSAANYFGEIVEWWGYALAMSGLPGCAFAFFTTCMLTKRGLDHHQFYLEKIPNYPRDRKAVIPFIL